MISPTIYIILLNWNGWADTIECLESVFINDYQNFRVIICDNDSQDNSLEQIKAWADDRLSPFVLQEYVHRNFTFSIAVRPIHYVEYSRTQAEAGGSQIDIRARLILIQTGKNLGFAGGNNVGLRYALKQNDMDYVWLLNNDTVIDKSALSEMLKCDRSFKQSIIGSKIYYYHDPHKIWFNGGVINKLKTKYTHTTDDINDIGELASFETDFITGCSMLIPRNALNTLGILDERYFLYFEDLDYCRIAKKSGYKLFVCPTSFIWHKVSVSIGSFTPSAFYYFYRNSLLYVFKNESLFISAYVALIRLLGTIKMILMNPVRAKPAFKGIIDAFKITLQIRE